MEVREATHTADDLLRDLRAGVKEIVRDALAEADRLREEADETLARYDEIVHEATRLRSAIFSGRWS
ncbi:MAG: hypothetical protein WKF67_12625 [Rubrobacteraceae bacterium]